VSDVVRISTAAAGEDRFARFELIGWWDQQRLANARVVVIGAGALGNELVKDLALLGVGRLFIADLDTIENSNLVAAERARDIYPGIRAQPFHGNIVYDLGLGVYRWADVILGGLDNREARVAINQAAARVGRIWIDGAIERLGGVARVFDPGTGPCYECTMSEVDWKMLEARRSCALLTRDEMEQGKVPTTPTTASIVAGIQAQEAVKLLHGLPTLAGQGFVFDGQHHQSYPVTYTRLEDCPSHDPIAPIVELPWEVATTRVGDLLERVRADLGPSAIIETNHDLLAALSCPDCGTTQPSFHSLGRVTERQGRCPQCGAHRVAEMYHTLDGRADLLDKTLGELGVPPWDILCGRSGERQCGYEIAGDKSLVLGELVEEGLPGPESGG
jgi:adenylyltransferase/sulfurtransferase